MQDVVLGTHLTDYVATIRSRPLVVVVLAPSVEAVAAREAGRTKTGYPDDSNSVADLDRALRAETPRVGLWLDSSNLTAAGTVDAIVERGLADGLVA